MTVRRDRSAAIATALAALLSAGLAATTSTTATAAPAAGEPAQERTGKARTVLSFTVEDCEGCEVHLATARRTLDADVVHVWQSTTREVADGVVTFRVPTRQTRGMTVTVRAPWEGHTGYATTVAWRYDGLDVGDAITVEEATTGRRAAACWAGTRQRRVTIPLVVEEVEVRGVHGRVPGSIAFTPVTQGWIGDMRRAVDGVLGSQDVDVCR